MKNKLKSYGNSSSLDGPAKVLSTGSAIPSELLSHFFKAAEVGEIGFTTFISRFTASDKNEPVSIFKPIKQSGIKTGLEKKKDKSAKQTVAVEEDRQAFGELVAGNISLNVALSHPLTKYPLSIATVEGNLRTGSK